MITNIETVKLSNKNPQSASNKSLSIHFANFISQTLPKIPTSYKLVNDRKQVIPTNVVVIRLEPFGPKKRPKKPDNRDAIPGIIIILKYINFFYSKRIGFKRSVRSVGKSGS